MYLGNVDELEKNHSCCHNVDKLDQAKPQSLSFARDNQLLYPKAIYNYCEDNDNERQIQIEAGVDQYPGH